MLLEKYKYIYIYIYIGGFVGGGRRSCGGVLLNFIVIIQMRDYVYVVKDSLERQTQREREREIVPICFDLTFLG